MQPSAVSGYGQSTKADHGPLARVRRHPGLRLTRDELLARLSGSGRPASAALHPAAGAASWDQGHYPSGVWAGVLAVRSVSAWSVRAVTPASRRSASGMVSARSRRADSTDSTSQAAASGSASGRMPPSAWARRIRSARWAAIARRAVRAGPVSAVRRHHPELILALDVSHADGGLGVHVAAGPGESRHG